jgi:hypothetical protein
MGPESMVEVRGITKTTAVLNGFHRPARGHECSRCNVQAIRHRDALDRLASRLLEQVSKSRLADTNLSGYFANANLSHVSDDVFQNQLNSPVV